MADIMDQRWACMTCNTTFPVGRMKLGRSALTLRCPNCDSEDTAPADGEVRDVKEYFGEIGTRN